MKRGEKNQMRGRLHSIHSLITNQFIFLWRPDHSRKENRLFSPFFLSLFCSIHFSTFFSPGFLHSLNAKPINRETKSPSSLSFSNRLHVQYFNKKSQLRWSHLREHIHTLKYIQTYTQQFMSGMRAVFYTFRVGLV